MVVRRLYDYSTTIRREKLRLLLASIGYRAKARKEIRRQPLVVPRRPPCPCRWTVPPPLAWSALCCTAWHRSTTGAHRCTLIYIIIVGGHVAPVQRPAWRLYLVSVEVLRLMVCPLVWCRRCIGGLCICCIVVRWNGSNSLGIPCKALCTVLWCGWYNCINGTKRTVNACIWLYCSKAK